MDKTSHHTILWVSPFGETHQLATFKDDEAAPALRADLTALLHSMQTEWAALDGRGGPRAVVILDVSDAYTETHAARRRDVGLTAHPIVAGQVFRSANALSAWMGLKANECGSKLAANRRLGENSATVRGVKFALVDEDLPNVSE